MLYLSMLIGLAGLYFGAEWLVRGASRIASALGIAPLVIGLTVVAFGTSMPEMVAGAVAAYRGATDVVIGNVLGSNIANIGLILGLSALVRTVPVHLRVLRREVPTMLVITVIVAAIARTGQISTAAGAVLVIGLIGFTWVALAWARAEGVAPTEVVELPPDDSIRTRTEVAYLVAGLVTLTAGAHLLVEAAQDLARQFGVSEFVIAASVVAIGTSLPELATSIVAAVRGEADVLVGNIVGSNIFNLLGALGVAAVIRPLPVAPEIAAFDVPVVIGFSLTMAAVIGMQRKVVRWEGAVLLTGYVAYIAVLVS